MQLFTHLRNSLFPVIDRRNKQIASLQQELDHLQQELREAAQQYRDEVAREKDLLQEIEYLYQIFIHRNHYRFQLHVFPKQAPVLLTIGKIRQQTHFVLYIPSLCREVAAVTTRPVNSTLVIEATNIDALIQNNRPFNVLFAQEIIAEAKAMGMEQVADVSGQTVAVGLAATERLCDMIGLTAPSEQEQPTGSVL